MRYLKANRCSTCNQLQTICKCGPTRVLADGPLPPDIRIEGEELKPLEGPMVARSEVRAGIRYTLYKPSPENRTVSWIPSKLWSKREVSQHYRP